MKRLFFILVYWVGFCGESWGQGWFPLGSGDRALKAHGPIYALCTDSNINIYAAGQFSDDTLMFDHAYVAKWDNMMHIWTKLGVGSTALNANDAINSIVADKHGNVYAAGDFTNGASWGSGFQYVAKWDGSSWGELGTGSAALHAVGSINSICIDGNGNIYAAGNFRNSYGESYVAKWNGAYWSELPGLHANLFINSICIDDSMNVYAGGTFSDTAGHKYVAKWNNAAGNWSELGLGFDSASTNAYVTALKVDTAFNVFAAVNFQHIPSGMSFTNILKWGGSAWSKMGNTDSALNANNQVFDLCLGDNGVIYAAGAFTNSSGETYVAKYDPVLNYWSELGTGANSLHPHGIGYGNRPPIYALCINKKNGVFAAGELSDSISYHHYFMYVAEYGISTLQVDPPKYVDREIVVYPNPANENINFRLPTCRDATVKLSDITGRILDTKVVCNSSNVIMDVHGYTPGTYFYEILFDGKVESGQVLIQ